MVSDSTPCFGTIRRRAFLRCGVGFGGLSLARLLRLESLAAAGSAATRRAKSVIVLWLWGGPSHMDTFDLKPDAPAEYRGEFRPVRTSAPGIEICEHLPRLARQAHRVTLSRSCHHNSSGHVNSTHSMMTGYPGELVEMPPYRPRYPDFWAVTSKVLGAGQAGAVAHVALPRVRYPGAAHLGPGLDPFVVAGDPSSEKFGARNLIVDPGQVGRLRELARLRRDLDRLRRDVDRSSSMVAVDRYQSEALALLTSSRLREAFEIEREDARTRDRYGRHAVGQRCLLARRLVEAGVRLVTIDFPCVPGQKAFSWDDHASVWNIFEQMKIRLPVLDQVASALIEDIYSRGLDRDVLFLVMGEMSHTPKLSNFKGQPGREHWARAMSFLVSGGGMKMGQVIGSTTTKGEEPRSRPLTPVDVLATWYRYLGVPLDLVYRDQVDRPVPVLSDGEPIHELF